MNDHPLADAEFEESIQRQILEHERMNCHSRSFRIIDPRILVGIRAILRARDACQVLRQSLRRKLKAAMKWFVRAFPMTQAHRDGEIHLDRIEQAFGHIQSRLCAPDVLADAASAKAYDFLSALYYRFFNDSQFDGQHHTLTISEACNPQEIAVLVELANTFEMLRARAAILVPFDCDRLSVRSKHLRKG